MMFSYFINSNKDKLLMVALLASLSLWSVVTSIRLLKKDQKVLVISVSENGTEVINEDDTNKRSSQDIMNLINMFVQTYYSYSQLSFDSQKKISLELFNDDLFTLKLDEAIKEKKSFKDRQFSQQAMIRKVSLLSDTVAEVELSKKLIEGGEVHEVNSKVIVGLSKVLRVKENPYGYEISSLKEKKRY